MVSLALPLLRAEDLKLVVVQGDKVANVDWQQESEPVVRVENAKGVPVSGAIVLFRLPEDKSGGEFGVKKGRNQTKTERHVVTGPDGLAKAGRIRPSKLAGEFQLAIRATYGDATATTTMTRENVGREAVEQSRRPMGKVGVIVLSAVLTAILLASSLSKL